MKDRVSTYPGRVTLTPVPGQENTFDLRRADQPTDAGTPINKASLLQDATAAQLGLTQENPTVNDALAGLFRFADTKCKIATVEYDGTGSSGEYNPTSITFPFEPQFVILTRGYNDTNPLVVFNYFLINYKVRYGQYNYASSFPGEASRIIYEWNEDRKTVSWYSAQGAQEQDNYSGIKYRAIAIG